MSAAYEVTLSLTDSESFRFDVPLYDEAGAPLAIDDLAFEYVLNGCEAILLTEADGITVDAETSTVTVALDPDRRLTAGQYTHGFRSTDPDGNTTQHFDGTVSVSCGGF